MRPTLDGKPIRGFSLKLLEFSRDFADSRFVTSRSAPAPLAADLGSGDASAVELDRILRERDLNVIYQPIFDLQTNQAVAFEALTRGPSGSMLEFPNELFAAAGAHNRLHELDVLCQTLALLGTHDTFSRTNHCVFVNVEPSVIGGGSDQHPLDDRPGLARLLRDSARSCPTMLEVCERDVFADPAALAATVAWARSVGFGIAVDDVGVNPRSLALLPLLEPDVIKLDMSLLHTAPTMDTGLVLNAVQAQSERTGALVVSEGIETEEHRTMAISMGAHLGQGFGLGRPAALPNDLPVLDASLTHGRSVQTEVNAPFDLVRDQNPLVATKELLLAISYDFERQATTQGDAPVLLSAFQRGFNFGGPTRRRYSEIAKNAALVGVVGTDIGENPAPGVHGGRLAATDPLANEWTVLVLSPHFAGGLLAIDLGDEGPEMQRRFAYAITHDRDVVTVAARSLMRRISSLAD